MSSVSRDIAERIVTGEFPEDNATAIWEYRNVFNGEPTYKVVFNYRPFDPDAIVGTDVRLWWTVTEGRTE